MKRRKKRIEDCVGKIVEILNRNVRIRILKSYWIECSKISLFEKGKLSIFY